MAHISRRDANLLGTLSVAVADRIHARAELAAEHGGAAPAALVALTTFLDGCSVEQLSAVVGLSHSATVRLVDKLEHRGLVRRRPAGDRRAVAVQLTPSGRATGSAILDDRAEAISDLLNGLSATERARLTELMERLLATLVDRRADPSHLCRLCDVEACGHWAGNCPVTEAGRQRAAR
jgi:MarR family transcriptional repressor of emrRAB